MYVIGLAGNIGTGKSTVARALASFGAYVIDADKVGHRLLDENQQVYNELIGRFGPGILDETGRIDRKSLAAAAFSSAEGTFWLNEITKYRIKEAVARELEELDADGVSVAVVEAAMMHKSTWKGIVNEIWVTTAPEKEIIKRLKANRGYKKEDTLQRLSRQMTPMEMLNQADVVIDTYMPMEDLVAQVAELWSELRFRMQHRSSVPRYRRYRP
jgi:dephospho-CoA kinase